MRVRIKNILVVLLAVISVCSFLKVGSVLAGEKVFKLTNAEIEEKSSTVEATIDGFDDAVVNSKAVFHKVDDYIIYKITIKNTSNSEYELKSIDSDRTNQYLTYEYTYDDTKLEPSSTMDILIKVTYKNEVENVANRKQDNDIKLTFTFEGEDGETVETYTINPKTHDNLLKYVTIFALCTTVLVITTVKSKKARALIVTAIVSTPFVTRAAQFGLIIDFHNEIDLNDKLVVTYNVHGQEQTVVVPYDEKTTAPSAPDIPGYNFVGWYIGNEEFDFTNTNIDEDTDITAKLELIPYTITVDLDGGTGTASYNYNVETETFDITIPEKTGYTFAGWTGSNGNNVQNRVTIYQGTTGDKSYVAHWSTRDDITFKVNHKYAKLNGGYDTEVEESHGVTASTIYPAIRHRDGFNDPQVTSLFIKPDGTAELDYVYPRTEYTLTIQNSADVQTTTPSGNYPYETHITLTAKAKTGYTFTGWSNSETTQTIEFDLTGNTTISPVYQINSYDVTFHKNDGTSVTTVVSKNYNTTIEENELPEITRDGYMFQGWFTDPEEGDEVTAPITVTDTAEYYAHWKQNPICYRAKVLHHEDCERLDSRGCVADGLTGNNRTTVYGTIVDHNGYIPGDAFDCDVNGNGQIDLDQNGDSLERFYYLRNVDDDHAALIYYINVVDGEDNQGVAIPYDASNKNYVEPTNLLSNLPTDWTNVELTNATEQIVNEQGVAMSKSQPLPTFDYTSYTSRMPVVEDIKAACGLTNVPTQTATTIPVEFNTGCGFLFENTTYMDPTVKSGYWLMTPTSSNNSSVFRLTGETHQLGNTQASNSTGAGIRPVIEVPLDRMQEPYADNEFGVPFDIRGGITAIPLYERTEGSTLGELPADPEKPGYIFLGWYMDMEYTIPATPDTPVYETSVVYARWGSTNAVATRGNKSYDSLAEAVSDTTDNAKNVIDLLKDTTESINVPNREIEINMNGHTVSVTSDACVFANKSGGTLILRNGTLTTTASTKAAIDNESGSTVYLSDVTIEATGARAALYNKDSAAYILNNSKLSTTASERAAVQNLGTGELYFVSGEAIAKNKQGILNENKLVIGEDDANANSNNPVISGKTYAITSTKDFYIYDGRLRSESANIIDNPSYLKTDGAIDTETGSEAIDTAWGSVTYNYMAMKNSSTKFKITLDPQGGEVNPTSITIDAGSIIGNLPIPIKGIYTFADWYKEETYINVVEPNTVPLGNSTYYARWDYVVSNEVITFDSTNNAMKAYYNSVSTWKNDSENYEATMLQNFLDNECQCEGDTCESPGTIKCDKPNGYDTTTGEDLNIYIFNESTSERGELVTYAKVENGIIYNLIPNQTYNWELKSDSNVHGFIKFTETRRIIDAGNIRNVRDLGGMSATYIDSETQQEVSGTLDYGRLFRGFKLGASATDLTELTKLGINEELDLRGTNNENEQKMDNYKSRDVAAYQIDSENYPENYAAARAVVKETMQDVINGKNIYIHCGGGTDRAGTLSYILEGLLGVPEEERLQDYDLSFFYGMINRHRYYSEDANSSEKFVYMHNLLDTNQKIYDWYMAGTENADADIELINNFRRAMVK